MNTYKDRLAHPKPSSSIKHEDTGQNKELTPQHTGYSSEEFELSGGEKYARMVFEVTLPKDATDEEICDAMGSRLTTFLQEQWGIDDIEIHNRPYIADECNNDTIGENRS